MPTAEDLALIRNVVDAAASSVGPVERAEILPAEAYVSETFFAFEKATIFTREWLCVGHVNEVPKPGDHVPLTILGEPIILARREAGDVRVLSAICQHRGHPLFAGLGAAPDGVCRNGRALVCPYHNWAYRLDGGLIGAPGMQETTPVARLRERIRLPALRVEIWHGLVFINFDADAEPLAPRLTKLSAMVENYHIEALRPAHTLLLPALPWNWKLHHENALEPYHTDYVHKGYHDAVPSRLTEFYEFGPDDTAVFRTTGFRSAGADLFEQGGSRLPEIEGLTDEQRGRAVFVSLMPNFFAVVQPSSVSMTIIDPVSAGVMNARRLSLYPAAAIEDPAFRRITTEQFETNKILVEQDTVTVTALQQAYQSRFTPRGTLSWLEAGLPQLNGWLVERYRRGLERLGGATVGS